MNPGSAYITRGINTIKSIVKEANLADLRKAYEIPSNVTLRVPSVRDLPSLPREGEIAITIPAFFCGLRVPFPAFLRRFFHLAPLHPVQLSPSGWQVLLGAYIQWRRLHNADPTMEELRATFSLRTSGVAGHYYGYRFTTPVLEGLASPKNWAKRWFFMGGAWEGMGPSSTWRYRVPSDFHVINWPTTRPTYPPGVIARSDLVLDLDPIEKSRREVLSPGNLRDYGLWPEPDTDLPPSVESPEGMDVPVEQDVPMDEHDLHQASSTNLSRPPRVTFLTLLSCLDLYVFTFAVSQSQRSVLRSLGSQVPPRATR